MQHIYIDSSEPLIRYLTPQEQYLLKLREPLTVEP